MRRMIKVIPLTEELLKFLRKADALDESVYSLDYGVNVRCVQEDAI